MSALKNRNLHRLFEHIQPYLHYSIPSDNKIPDGKVLILSPNQQDWAIGCAGVLLKNARNSSSFEIVYCTSEGAQKMKESEKAASLLGIKRSHFFQFPNNGLKADKNFCGILVKLFDKIQPETVFLPFWFDNCPDHIALSRALVKIRKDIDLRFTVYAYGIWSPIIPNCVFDISAQWEAKKNIIERYEQTKNDWTALSQGINQYWGAVMGHKMQYAEVFFTSTASKYISLGRKILG